MDCRDRTADGRGWKDRRGRTGLVTVFQTMLFGAMVFSWSCDPQGERPSPDSLLVRGLDLDQIAIYQSLEIPLMTGWHAVEIVRTPLIQGKDSVLRITVSPQPEWRTRRVRCRVDLSDDFGGLGSLMQERVISESENGDLEFLIDIPGDFLSGDLHFSVALMETGEGWQEQTVGLQERLEDLGTTHKSMWPQTGMQRIPTTAAAGPLRITIIPVQYNADKSGRLPDLSDQQIQLYRAMFYGLYPVSEVMLEVGPALQWRGEIHNDGAGWDQLLSAVAGEREARGALPNEFYFGLFVPADSFAEYCGMGCVLGLSPLAVRAEDTWAQVSIGLGFQGIASAVAMVHEVGHTHGREHAPCGLVGQPADSLYPYRDGKIGVFGFDLQNSVFKDPSVTSDFMSYCRPIWVSDYTYNGLFERMIDIAQLSQTPGGEDRGKTTWASISMGLDGTLSPGAAFQLDQPPGGAAVELDLLGARHQLLGTTRAVFVPYGHDRGGLILFEEPGPQVLSVRLPDHKVFLLRETAQ